MNFNDLSLIFILFSSMWMLFFSIFVRRHIEYFFGGVKNIYFFSIIPFFMMSLIGVEQLNSIIPFDFKFLKAWNILQLFSLYFFSRFIFNYKYFNKIIVFIFYTFFCVLIFFVFYKSNYSFFIFIPSFIIIIMSFFHFYFIRKKEYSEKGFFYYVLSSIIILAISYTLKNTLYANISSQDMLIAILIIYSHYKLNQGILKFYAMQKTKLLHKFYSSVIVMSISLCLFFIFSFLFMEEVLRSYVLSGQIICFLFSISFGFIVLQNVFIFMQKKLDNIFYSQENDYFQRLSDCGNYLKNLLYIKEFISFISGVLKEFFEASHFTILVLHNDVEDGFRVISSSSDRVVRDKNQTELLKTYFTSKRYFQFSDLIDDDEESTTIKDIIRIMSLESDLNTFIKIDHDNTAVYIFSFHMRRLISPEKLEKIYMKSNIFGDCLDNILLYEKKKTLLMQKFTNTQKEFDLRELEHENEELQKSYEKIRNLQNDIIKKERQAALTKFTISIDDEISNPLNNMLMAIQYQLEKMQNSNFNDIEKRDKLLQIIVTQSIRIKNILDELRKVADDYNKMKH